MHVAVGILQSDSDWTAIFLQQNKSGYRAGTRPSVFRVGRVTPDTWQGSRTIKVTINGYSAVYLAGRHVQNLAN